MHLQGLFDPRIDSRVSNLTKFEISNSEIDGPIYEFLYVDGSFDNGKLTGRWVPPPASPTNAALLWPETQNIS